MSSNLIIDKAQFFDKMLSLGVLGLKVCKMKFSKFNEKSEFEISLFCLK